MKLLFVNTHYLPDVHYGGVVESGSKLLKYFRKMGEVHLSTVSRTPKQSVSHLEPGDVCYQSYIFHRFAVSPYAFFGLFRDVYWSDVVMVNGIFTFPVTIAAFYAIILGKPFIVATRGGFGTWRRAYKKWRKYFYTKFITLPLMRRARWVHVTSDSEREELKSLGFINTILVSNGIDFSDFGVLSPKWVSQKFLFLFLSRTDKEKGLDILIEAYRRFCKTIPNLEHHLIICGPDSRGYLKNFELNYEAENISFLPGRYGPDKIKLIRDANVFVLPSYSENFGNVVAEALACETPVITTTGTPWAEIEKVGCGLYIKPEAEALYQAMVAMYNKTPQERAEMGRRGREYIFKNFNWEDKAKELFRYLQEIAGEKSTC